MSADAAMNAQRTDHAPVNWSAEARYLRELEHAAVIQRVRALANLGLSETFLAMLTAWAVVDVRRILGALR